MTPYNRRKISVKWGGEMKRNCKIRKKTGKIFTKNAQKVPLQAGFTQILQTLYRLLLPHLYAAPL
ncbi:hypothetical protein H6B15_12345 [Gemmiger formicilis]|uniref:hypothetical protein n=1 Tax=Gemmiger formicilis TaxID=745368 RepID=UPI00195F02C8|nr:hypothetical protein [Gemmiger formicilis]MBM6717445.1 hypothetical protein [Gemmiger formicilis]